MENRALPDTWSHATSDDYGHVFDFFWHPLDAPAAFTAPYRRALNHISQALS